MGHQLDEVFKKPVNTPWPTSRVDLEEQPLVDDAHVTMYRSVVGSLLYLAYLCRLDICLAVGVLSSMNHYTTEQVLNLAKRLCKYVNTHHGVLSLGDFRVPINQWTFEVFADASWASLLDHHMSRSGQLVSLSPPSGSFSHVYWKSKLQKKVATSSMASELQAMVDTTNHALYLRSLFKEMTGCFLPMNVHEDNKDNLDMVLVQRRKLPRNRSLTLAIRYLREVHSDEPKVNFKWTPSGDNLSDELTKPLPVTKLIRIDSCLSG